MRTPDRRLHLLVALGAVLLLQAGRPAGAAEDLLAPTPARSVDDVRRTMNKHGIPPVELKDEQMVPEERSVVGALTKHRSGRLGFMPLLHHHMAVEHWFLEGLTPEMLGEPLNRKERIFARLRGRVRLTHMWSPGGGGGLEWYGNGLAHGKVYGDATGGVMGYHERVYRFQVEAVEWRRSRSEMGRLTGEYEVHAQALKKAIEKGDWAQALAATTACRERKDDIGIFRFEDDSASFQAFLLLEGDAERWSDENVRAIAAAFGGDLPFRIRKPAWATFAKAAPGLPPSARERLAIALTEVWRGLEYRHQKEKLWEHCLKKLRGEATARLEAEIAETRQKLAALSNELQSALDGRAYADALATWKRIEPLQALLLTREYDDGLVKRWLPSLGRCIALEAVWDDETKRLELLETHVRETVEKGEGYANSKGRPRFAQEMKEHFLPQLSARHRRRVERQLIEIGDGLDPEADWKQFLLVAEMLVGVAGKDAKKFMPRFIRRRGDGREWQLDLLRQFQREINKRVR